MPNFVCANNYKLTKSLGQLNVIIVVKIFILLFKKVNGIIMHAYKNKI